MKAVYEKESLRICMLSYRSNPHCGGQGVYIRNLSRELKNLGHKVEVLSGVQDPLLDEGIKLTMLDCLDLYNPDDMFRVPSLKELSNPINLLEWLGTATMGFPEPFTYGLRAYQYLRNRLGSYDVIHDNQSLSYGTWAMSRRLPTIATIHHPITVDREIAVSSVTALWKKMKEMRWYSFIDMQKRVVKKLEHIITVSDFSRDDICSEFKISSERFKVVPNGINTELFYPVPEIQRKKNRLIVTNSSDTPLKGLYYLLHAVAEIAKSREIELIVIGSPKKNGGIERLVKKLDISHLITFTGRIDDHEFLKHYAKASIAVVPSVYEGFGLPVGEAMACGLPVISTTGGALPEVVGDAGVLVPPSDPDALAGAVIKLIDNPDLAEELGRAGYKRVQEHFTWKRSAEMTVEAYREAIRDYS
ncbi:MAG: glycosyltransferase family 4 protein [Desulfobacteraceae bacterium]|nr:glycosyltransferase family 4 protein [Desulfobacteraceae bacterium]MBT4362922.1 glycosyltransferase family 4 protein [Desulfobacteraceae bacterium]